MGHESTDSNPSGPTRWRRFVGWLWGLWPQWPMAITIVASGTVNILKSLNLDLLPFGQFIPHVDLGKSLAILGNSTQAILGIGLVFVGFGIVRRLAAAWSFADNAGLHLHADYLVHKFDLIPVEKGSLPFYFGIGGRIRFAEGNGDDRIGIRIPVGLDYIFADAPLDIFLELVPILDLAPDTDLDFNGAVGIRFFF